MIFELCAETIEACLAAQEGGADRVELCAALEVQGLTPSHALVKQAVSQCKTPIHVMVRPRAGGFCYDASDFSIMRDEIQTIRSAGAAGVVLGVLLPSGAVDIERTHALVQLVDPLASHLSPRL